MPFTETDIVDERTRFIEDAHRSLHSFTWLCEQYGISRKTGYEWLDRWRTHGPEGLRNRSSRPMHCPWATPPEALSANVRETRSTQRIRVGRRQRKRTCWDCEREWKRMVVPLEPGRPSEARQLLRTRR